MRFPRDNPSGWYQAFAILPIFLRDEIIWWEWVWKRNGGDCTEVMTGPIRPDRRPERQSKGVYVAGEGYQKAFYELADLMGIPAQTVSPNEVWETMMKPRLKELLR